MADDDGWIPGLIHLPGRQAGYASGRIQARLCVSHETVGANSTGIGMDGYFNFLYPKVGPAEQYAEWDAVSWHACNWNPYAHGHELERFQGEPMTEDQMHWIAYTFAWIEALSGQPIGDSLYDGPRLAVGDFSHPWACHRAIDCAACGNHSDFWSPGEAAAIVALMGGASAPAEPTYAEDDTMFVFGESARQPGWVHGFHVLGGGLIAAWFASPPGEARPFAIPPTSYDYVNATNGVGRGPLATRPILPHVVDWIVDVQGYVLTPPAQYGSGGGAGGATPAQVTAIVGASEGRVIAEVEKPRGLVGQVQ